MRILMVGGGSGGHVTPLKSVADELAVLSPETTVLVVTDRRFAPQAAHLLGSRFKLKKIYAGKLRRYGSKSLLWHVLHLPTLLKNIRDVAYLIVGFFQSLLIVMRYKPDVVFSKGGFVAVPVGFAAKCFGKKLIIHDSDTHAGLASRLLAKHAGKIATGMPEKYYSYPKNKMIYTGIPVSKKFQPVGEGSRGIFLKEAGLDQKRPLLLLTGGGMGAKQLNECLEAVAGELIEAGWQIVEVTGVGKSDSAIKERSQLPKSLQRHWRIEEFVDLTPYILACDVSLVRTGATTMQELANARKVVITVPSPHLTDQNKNAKMFKEQASAIVLSQDELAENPKSLLDVVASLHSDKKMAQKTKENLHTKFAKPGAAKQLAQLLLKAND